MFPLWSQPPSYPLPPSHLSSFAIHRRCAASRISFTPLRSRPSASRTRREVTLQRADLLPGRRAAQTTRHTHASSIERRCTAARERKRKRELRFLSRVFIPGRLKNSRGG
ncbi:hypothetical protein PUN28_011360 [Cardiocondyla obscurior]|uniref:Uncharacterized protein n=1 Tax=Cardiocondyla obscurior TaxID=286306 RepID=A0AAW2FG12_9HYME